MKLKPAAVMFIALAFTGILLLDGTRPSPVRAAEYRIGAVTANVNLRKTPGLQGDIVAGLQEGLPVKVYGEKDGWYRVSANKNYTTFNGWVYNRYVEIVSETTVAPLPAVAKTPPRPDVQPAAAPQAPVKAPPAPVATARPLTPSSPPPAESTAPMPEISPAPADSQPESAAAKMTRSATGKHITAPETSARPDAASDNTGNLRLLLSISPLVLAIIALLVAVRAFRAVRTPAPKSDAVAAPQVRDAPDRTPTITPGKPPVNEKRRAPRSNRLIEVDFAVSGKFFRGFINNLSETGVYIDTPEKFNVGQDITISCPSIDTAGHIKRDGMIVRLTETGVAVHFQQSALP
jgi:SH3-like domain-containing protein